MPAVVVIAAVSGASAAVGAAAAAAIGLGTVSTIAATAIGSGLIAGATTAVMGGDASDILESAVIGGVASYAGGTVGASVGSAVAESTGSAAAGGAAGGASGAVTSAAISGADTEDLGTAALVGGALGGLGGYKQELQTQQDLSQMTESGLAGQTSVEDTGTYAAESNAVPTSTVENPDGTVTYSFDDGTSYTADQSGNVVSTAGMAPVEGISNEGAVTLDIPSQEPVDNTAAINAITAAQTIIPVAQAIDAIQKAKREILPGYEAVTYPDEWIPPEYTQQFTPSAPINFGDPELLQGTQWQNPVTLSSLINTLNQPAIPVDVQNMMATFQAPEVPYTTGINDIIGNVAGTPVSIADIIAGIQSGQNYTS